MTKPEPKPITLDDVANLVRLLALTTRNDARPGSNLVQPALIQQLRTNIVPDGDGGAGGRGKPVNERSPINAAALTLYEFVVSRIARLYEEGTGLKPAGAPEELLMAWYVVFAIESARGEVVQQQLDHLHARLDDWRTRIMDLFSPPERMEIPHACPECGWKHITRTTPDGTIRQYALVGIARPWRNEEGVICRGCQYEWIGEMPLLELAADLGIDLNNILTPKPPTPPPAPPTRPLWLLAMTADQAKQFARDRGLEPKDYVLASGPIQRLQRTAGPVYFATTDVYTPGPHEARRVKEARRIAILANNLNGYDDAGKPPTEKAHP